MVYDDNNIFAKILRGDMSCHKIYEDDKTLAFMDIMPIATGHSLVIPKCQAVELSDMPIDYINAVFATAKKVMNAQRRVLNTQGIVQMQLNDAQAGQSVLHYHIHLVPTHISQVGRHESNTVDNDKLAQLAQQLSQAINL